MAIQGQSASSDFGRLIVIAAPSGAGKTTLVRALLARLPQIQFSISYTTRPQRPSEREGRDYFFVTESRFKEMIASDALLEHACVFGHYYGTGRQYVEDLLAAGSTVLLEIDWQGAQQVRQCLPGAITLFILPPSLAELERRLRGRRTDSREVIERRLGEALDDIRHWAEFDYVLVNEDLDRAADELAAIVAGRSTQHRTDLPQTRQVVERIIGGGAGKCEPARSPDR